jgi:hypothetical protein
MKLTCQNPEWKILEDEAICSKPFTGRIGTTRAASVSILPTVLKKL